MASQNPYVIGYLLIPKIQHSTCLRICSHIQNSIRSKEEGCFGEKTIMAFYQKKFRCETSELRGLKNAKNSVKQQLGKVTVQQQFSQVTAQ